ncbi:MAG TPA: SpoIIE family protein phosphatase [Kofleriaceae bacterium]|nr:SpoIIE family protein phosphatase [Kofleriaceae bacterium]
MRLSVSVKMILTTTLLIVVTVVGFGLLIDFNLGKVFDDTAARQIRTFEQGRELLGETGTLLFARTVQPLVVENKDNEIGPLMKEMIGQDTKDAGGGRKDFLLKLAFVLDLNQKLMVHCFEDAKQLACVEGKLPREGIEQVGRELSKKAWDTAIAEWKQAAANKGPALVRFDLTGDDARYRVFAYPIFTNAPPTAAGAVAENPPDARRGYVVLGYDLAPTQWFAEAAAQQRSEVRTRTVLFILAAGALFALIGTVLAIFQGLSISRPIKQLAWKADRIARGDLEARVEVKSSDEIGFLGENFNYMADQIAILLQQTAEKARIEQELEVAKAIQETLVPGPEPVDRGAVKFAGFYQPAAQTGGDWWTWHELVGGKVLLVIGDVTGHGVPSAMITAAAKAACDVARHVHGDDVTVTRLLEIMNHAIWQSAQRRFVMTCFASIIDPRTRVITYANAGHNFPYLFRAGAADGKGEFGSLMIRGNRLGDDPSSRYEAKTTELVPGDVLVWYTDGIVECENATGEQYGEKRFRASVRRAAALSAGEMRDAIVGEATSYFGDTPRKDDITMIVGRIH